MTPTTTIFKYLMPSMDREDSRSLLWLGLEENDPLSSCPESRSHCFNVTQILSEVYSGARQKICAAYTHSNSYRLGLSRDINKQVKN